MQISRAKVPPAFFKALDRPLANDGLDRVPSQVENLRYKLASYYRLQESLSNTKINANAATKLSDHIDRQQQQHDDYWEQSGQVMRWLADHVAKDKEYNNVKSAISNVKSHQQFVSSLVDRLIKNEPLAYVLGTQPFGPLEIKCQKPVLIPRPETEHLVEHLSQILIETSSISSKEPLKILDMCTGTGCIALLLQYRLNEAKIKAEITAIDKSQDAVTLALFNQEACLKQELNRDTSSSFARIKVEKVDIFDDVAIDHLIYKNGPFDVISSNPPYVTSSEWLKLDQNVKDWEDKGALVGDIDDANDGLAFYRRIAHLVKLRGILTKQSTSSNRPNLLLEVGHSQANAIKDILTDTGQFSDKMTLLKDPWQKERGVMAWYRPARS